MSRNELRQGGCQYNRCRSFGGWYSKMKLRWRGSFCLILWYESYTSEVASVFSPELQHGSGKSPVAQSQTGQRNRYQTSACELLAAAGKLCSRGMEDMNHGLSATQNRWASKASKHQGLGIMRMRGWCARYTRFSFHPGNHTASS